jgi:hypothetical protein
MYGLSQFQRFLPQNPQEVIKVLPKFNPFKSFSQDDDNFKVSLFHTPYESPSITDMLVIIPLFNPCNSVRILQNMLLVRNKLEQSKIPFVVIHCLFPNSMPLGDENDNYIIVRSNSYAFLKENLANIVINKHIHYFDKFVIHDSDILFENKDWYEKVSLSLNDADIVQPFQTFKNLDKNFLNITKEGISLFQVYQQQPDNVDVLMGHPGYLIAFTKEYWKCHGYPEENLIGGGDTLTCSLALKTKLFEKHHNSVHMEFMYNKYNNGLEIKTNFVEGTIYHLYHNISSNRQYTTRYFILNNYIHEDSPYNNITDIIKRNIDGVYEWIDEIRDEINNDILNYFATRQDDEIPNTQD